MLNSEVEELANALEMATLTTPFQISMQDQITQPKKKDWKGHMPAQGKCRHSDG